MSVCFATPAALEYSVAKAAIQALMSIALADSAGVAVVSSDAGMEEVEVEGRWVAMVGAVIDVESDTSAASDSSVLGAISVIFLACVRWRFIRRNSRRLVVGRGVPLSSCINLASVT